MHGDTNPLIEGFRQIAAVMTCHAGEQSDAYLSEAMTSIEEIIRQSRWAQREQVNAAREAEILELRQFRDTMLNYEKGKSDAKM